MQNKRYLLVWEEVSTTRRNIYKKLQRFMWIFFSFSFFLSFFCISESCSVSHKDIILVNKFHIMLLQDTTRINIFRKNIKNMLAKRDWCNHPLCQHLCESLFFNKAVSFLIKLPCSFIKKVTLAQIFFCVFCEISKIFFAEHFRATDSAFRRC